MEILAYLATFLAVISGACIALSGVILTNRAHDRRLQTQLDHDQKLKNREREMSLRRDVYLAAAEAVQAGLIAIGRFSNLEIPHEKITEGYLDKAPSIAKVHIIATEETVKALINFSAGLNATFLRLFAKRGPLVSQKQQIEVLRAQVDTSIKENSRTFELMRQYNLDGLSDQRKWDLLQRNFDFEQRRSEGAKQEADTLAVTLYLKQLQYMEECSGETMELGHLLTPLVFSVRKELELPIDEVAYGRAAGEAAAKQHESLKEFIQQLKSGMAGPTAAAGDAPPAPGS